jgi:ribosomal protein S18 acetylase RimI-like enzyme
VRVRLDPMTDEEYADYLDRSVDGYAQEKVKSGEWSAQVAFQQSLDGFRKLLPQGLETVDNHLFTVRDAASSVTGERVGILWIALRDKAGARESYIYDIEMAAEVRGRGYGRAAMNACAEVSRELGASTVGLHVFGHNAVAQSLYTSLGFVPTNIIMSLDLSRDADEAVGEIPDRGGRR